VQCKGNPHLNRWRPPPECSPDRTNRTPPDLPSGERALVGPALDGREKGRFPGLRGAVRRAHFNLEYE
jgi:hypothetical protein